MCCWQPLSILSSADLELAAEASADELVERRLQQAEAQLSCNALLLSLCRVGSVSAAIDAHHVPRSPPTILA